MRESESVRNPPKWGCPEIERGLSQRGQSPQRDAQRKTARLSPSTKARGVFLEGTERQGTDSRRNFTAGLPSCHSSPAVVELSTIVL